MYDIYSELYKIYLIYGGSKKNMYTVIQGMYHNEEQGSYTSYGIQNKERGILVEDICLNKEMMQGFIDTLNRTSICEEDFLIYIDDFLAAY